MDTINALDNILKKQLHTLSYSNGYISKTLYYGWYETFYLKRAYYIDANNVNVPVPVIVDFGTSSSIAISSTSVFTDGLGIRLRKPFSYVQLACKEAIAGNPTIYVEFYVANGDIIDNINYMSGSLNVAVTNFPNAVSAALHYEKGERLIADKAVDKTITVNAVVGLNSYVIYTATVAGNYINTGVKTSLLVNLTTTPPTTAGRYINRLCVSPRITLDGVDNWDNPPIIVAASFVNPLWPNIPFELRNTGFSRIKSGNSTRIMSLSDYVYDVAPLKIQDTQLVIDLFSYQRIICESSKINISVNII